MGIGSYSVSPNTFVLGSSGNSFTLDFNTQGSSWVNGVLSIFIPSTLGMPNSSNFYEAASETAFVNSISFVTPTPIPGGTPNPGMVAQVEMNSLNPSQDILFYYGDNPPVPGPAGFSVSNSATNPTYLMVGANPNDPNLSDPPGALANQVGLTINTPVSTQTDTPTSTTSPTPASPTDTPTPTQSFTVSPTYTITPIGPQVGSLYVYPNPFDMVLYNKCTFRFPNQANASIEVFNIAGEPVCQLQSSEINAPAGWAIWPGTDDYGRMVAGGIYFVRVSGSTTMVRKFTVLK